MTVRGIHRAPEGAPCAVCREPIPDDQRPRSARASLEIDTGAGVASFTIWLCRRCAATAGRRALGGGTGALIVNDAIEGALRTLVRLRDIPESPEISLDGRDRREVENPGPPPSPEGALRISTEGGSLGEIRIRTDEGGFLGPASAGAVVAGIDRSLGTVMSLTPPDAFASRHQAIAGARRQDWSPLRCSCRDSLACFHPWPRTPDDGRIQAGDIVRHRPSGEELFVLGVYTPLDNVVFAGRPASIADMSDCDLLRKGIGINLKEREYRNRMFGACWDDERRGG